jgi:multiple sugar transport system permease protein
MIAMLAYPLLYLIDLSVSQATMLRPPMAFVGWMNFSRVISDADFRQALAQTAIWTVSSVFLTVFLGFVSALLLNEKFPGRSILRVLILLPWIFPYVAAAIQWRFLLTQPFGHIDYWLHSIGLLEGGMGALGDSTTAMLTAIIVNSWKHFPFIMLMLLAGLQAIPDEIHDAARVDGATYMQRLRLIILPMLRPVLMISLLVFIIWSLNAFSIVFLLTDGGPGKSTEIVPLYIYRLSFVNFEFGLSSAASLILFSIGLVFALLYVRTMKETL